jgi:hypothetical protein
VGVFDEEGAAPWQRKAKDGMAASRLLDLLGACVIDSAFVGNYHNHRIWTHPGGQGGRTRTIVQVGTLCPASFSDPQEGVGLVALSDGRSVRMEEVPGPRFRTGTYDRLTQELALKEECSYYLRVTDAPAECRGLPVPFTTNVHAIDIVHRDLKPDDGAGAVRISHTPEEALRAACAVLEPAELRGHVQALVDEAWRQGA